MILDECWWDDLMTIHFLKRMKNHFFKLSKITVLPVCLYVYKQGLLNFQINLWYIVPSNDREAVIVDISFVIFQMITDVRFFWFWIACLGEGTIVGHSIRCTRRCTSNENTHCISTFTQHNNDKICFFFNVFFSFKGARYDTTYTDHNTIEEKSKCRQR